jgi:putative mRNA 3-end processing factor
MIRILENGGILFDNAIVCDGHDSNAILRIQSHIHTDHLAEFGASKQQHPIIMSEASREYLALSKNNMDIVHRPGIIGLPYNKIFEYQGYKIRLLSNEHCLGSSQVEIVTPNGVKYGYSGDFNYPMESVISVEHLIIDGSCGGIFYQRRYTREDSIKALEEKLKTLVSKTPVYIKAHKGLLEKIYFWIEDICPNIKRVGSCEFIESLKLHEKYSYGVVDNIIETNSEEEKCLKRNGEAFIQFVHKKETVFNVEKKHVIQCDRFNDRLDVPLREISPLSFHISFSDHSDINGTYEYIRCVDPKNVYIDGVRAQSNAGSLANLIYHNCGVYCSVLKPEVC